MTKRTKKDKTDVLKANLNKSLDKLKERVAEKEDVWLDFFGMLCEKLIEGDMTLEKSISRVEYASLVADEMLEKWEGRWGG